MSPGNGALLQRGERGLGSGGGEKRSVLWGRGRTGQEVRDSLKGSISCFLDSRKLGKSELG